MCLCVRSNGIGSLLFVSSIVVYYILFSFRFVFFLYSILGWVPKERYHIDEHKCQEKEKKKKQRRRKRRQYSGMKKNERVKREKHRIEWDYTYYFEKSKCSNYQYIAVCSQCRLLTLQSVFFLRLFFVLVPLLHVICACSSRKAHIFPLLFLFRFRHVRLYGL